MTVTGVGNSPTGPKIDLSKIDLSKESLRLIKQKLCIYCECPPDDKKEKTLVATDGTHPEKKGIICEKELNKFEKMLQRKDTQGINKEVAKLLEAAQKSTDKEAIQFLNVFLEKLGEVIELKPYTPEVSRMFEEAMSSPRMSPPETTPIHSTQNQTAPDNTTIIAHDKTSPPLQNTQDVAAKDIQATQKLPEATPKEPTITTFLSEMVNLPEPEQIVILKAPEKPKDKAPEILDKKPEKIEHKKQDTPTLDTARRESPAPTQKSDAKTPNLSTNDTKHRSPEPITFKETTAKPVQSSSPGHTEKTLILEHKLNTIISDKAQDAVVVLKETIAQVLQNPPQEATVKMTTLANVIAHVGKADTHQLAPTLTLLKSVMHMPADSVATVGHSLALVAKQSPEALPIVREMLQSLPQTPATLTAAAQTILACLEAIPTTAVNHAALPTPKETLSTLANAIITVAKAAPESLPQVLATLSTVAETAPNTLPNITNVISSMTKQAPKTLENVTQIIQTLSSAKPEILPKLATTLLSLSKTTPPQQMQTVITVLNTVINEPPASLSAYLDLLTTPPQSGQSQTGPLPSTPESVSTVFRQISGTGPRNLENTVQSLTFHSPTQSAPTNIAELKTQTRQDATLQLLNSTVKTAPETLPLLITILKSSQSQPVVAAKLMTVLQDIQNNHPQDMPNVAKALSNFTQSAPQNAAKAVTLIATVLAQSPKTVAPLATALQIISTGPFAVQKEALQHLEMARNKNIQTLHHSASEMATLKTTRSTPKSETTTFRTTQVQIETHPSRTENPVVLQKTPRQQKPTGEPFRSMPHTQQIHATTASNIPTASRPPATSLQVQNTLVAQYPQLRGQVSALFTTITTIAPAALPHVATALSDIATHAPQHLEAAITLLANIADKAPAALQHVATALSDIATIAPQHLEAAITLLANIADKAPTALQHVATALSDIATIAPQHLEAAITLLANIADKAPAALQHVATALSDIAKVAPQHLGKAIALLASIADKAPATLHHVAATISTVATQAPQHLAVTLTLLDTIADKAPGNLAVFAQALNTLAQKSPELFKMGLDIAQKIADKAPDLLPKLSQFLVQFQDSGHQDQLHTQLLALMQALASEASEDQAQLLQKLLTLGDIKASKDPALHAYVLGEIKKTKKTDKEKHAQNQKRSSTDQLIMLFDSLEKEDWKLAAMFRKILEERQYTGSKGR